MTTEYWVHYDNGEMDIFREDRCRQVVGLIRDSMAGHHPDIQQIQSVTFRQTHTEYRMLYQEMEE